MSANTAVTALQAPLTIHQTHRRYSHVSLQSAVRTVAAQQNQYSPGQPQPQQGRRSSSTRHYVVAQGGMLWYKAVHQKYSIPAGRTPLSHPPLCGQRTSQAPQRPGPQAAPPAACRDCAAGKMSVHVIIWLEPIKCMIMMPHVNDSGRGRRTCTGKQ